MKKNIVQFERSEHVADDWYLVANRNTLTIKIRDTVTLGESEQGLLVLDSRVDSERWVTLEVDPKGCLNVIYQAAGYRLVCPERWIMDTAGAIVPRCTMLEMPHNHVYVSQQLQRGKVEQRVLISRVDDKALCLPPVPEAPDGESNLPANEVESHDTAPEILAAAAGTATPASEPADLDAKRRAEAELQAQEESHAQEALEEALNEVVLTRDVLEEMLSALEAQDTVTDTPDKREVAGEEPGEEKDNDANRAADSGQENISSPRQPLARQGNGRTGDALFKLVENTAAQNAPGNMEKQRQGRIATGQNLEIPLLQDVATIFVTEPEAGRAANTPGVGQSSVANKAREATKSPESKAPAVTKSPTASKAPAVTKAPAATKPPATTNTPTAKRDPIRKTAEAIQPEVVPFRHSGAVAAPDLTPPATAKPRINNAELHTANHTRQPLGSPDEMMLETDGRSRSRSSISIALGATLIVGLLIVWSLTYQPERAAVEENLLAAAPNVLDQPAIPSAASVNGEAVSGLSSEPILQPVITPAASAEYTSQAEQEAAINDMLNNAAELMAEGFITWPERNAVSLLHAVLVESPDNLQAQQLLDAAATQLLEQAQQAYNDGFTDGARAVVDDVLQFHPGWPAAIDLKFAWQDALAPGPETTFQPLQ